MDIKYKRISKGVINLRDMKEFLLGRISHASKRIDLIKGLHGNNPNETHNYFGGQTLGYWQGKLSAYEIILYEMEESE